MIVDYQIFLNNKGRLKWAHKNRPLQIDFLIRYYMTLFVKNSIR